MRRLLALLTAAPLLAGCGAQAPADTAVEAREGNVVEVGDVRYRVTLFRELNVHTAPDDALWEGEPPEPSTGLYMAVLRVCAGDDPATTTADVHLEDAFGQRFEPRADDTADELEYRPTELGAGACAPGPDSAAEQTLDGGALVFAVPFESTEERPMILEIGDARVELDL